MMRKLKRNVSNLAMLLRLFLFNNYNFVEIKNIKLTEEHVWCYIEEYFLFKA